MTSGNGNAWYTRIQLSDQETLFKLDTGAEVSAISEQTYQHIGEPELHTPLSGPSQQPLEVLGQFVGTLTHNSNVSKQKVFVVKHLKTNLLGLPAIKALHLAARVDTTSATSATSCDLDADISRNFPNIFKGLGNLGEEFEIKLKPDVELFVP